MDHSHTDIWFSAVALGCAAVACSHDLRTRRIPNWITGPAALSALLIHFAVGGWASLGASAAAGLVAGLVMVAFFLAGGMGAGDVKLMAAVACFTGLAPLCLLLLTTACTGAALAIVLALRHGVLARTLRNCMALLQHHHESGLVPHAEHTLRGKGGLRMPFALPIAAGCVCTLLVQVSAAGGR